MYQKTIKRPISFSGISLHKGLNSEVTIKPNNEYSGIIFKRIDFNDNNLIKANYINVIDTNLCTVIANKNGLKVRTIEHLMAALSIYEVDNAIIEINCEELPALDGSADLFCEMLDDAGTKNLSKLKKIIRILKPLKLNENDKTNNIFIYRISLSGGVFYVNFLLLLEPHEYIFGLLLNLNVLIIAALILNLHHYLTYVLQKHALKYVDELLF